MKKVVIVHGLGQTPNDWKQVIEQLDESNEVICPDLFSLVDKQKLSFETLAQSFEFYCSKFDQPIILVGLSLGAVLAFEYANRHPGQVDSLIIIAAPYQMPKKLLKFQNMVFHLMPSKSFSKIKMTKKEMISLCQSMMDLDYSDQLKEIGCPTLVLCGSKDKANYSSCLRISKEIPNSKFSEISFASHEVNKGNPQKTAELINAFLGQDKLKGF